MGGKVENISGSKASAAPQTVLEAEKNDKIPRGLTLYLSEQIANALKGKGTKDPAKIVANALNNYSETSYYKQLKKVVKKVGEGSIWVLDKTLAPFLINKDIPPYGMGSFDNQQGVWM